MVELIHSAQNYMNAKGAIIAKKRKRVERMEANPMCHSEQGPRPKKGRTEDKKTKIIGRWGRSQEEVRTTRP